jgi:hypothetical protein
MGGNKGLYAIPHSHPSVGRSPPLTRSKKSHPERCQSCLPLIKPATTDTTGYFTAGRLRPLEPGPAHIGLHPSSRKSLEAHVGQRLMKLAILVTARERATTTRLVDFLRSRLSTLFLFWTRSLLYRLRRLVIGANVLIELLPGDAEACADHWNPPRTGRADHQSSARRPFADHRPFHGSAIAPSIRNMNAEFLRISILPCLRNGPSR